MSELTLFICSSAFIHKHRGVIFVFLLFLLLFLLLHDSPDTLLQCYKESPIDLCFALVLPNEIMYQLLVPIVGNSTVRHVIIVDLATD